MREIETERKTREREAFEPKRACQWQAARLDGVRLRSKVNWLPAIGVVFSQSAFWIYPAGLVFVVVVVVGVVCVVAVVAVSSGVQRATRSLSLCLNFIAAT